MDNMIKSHLARGVQIIYVPDHAKNNLFHPDCQPGFVTSVAKDHAFCRYWLKKLGGSKDIVLPPTLRTKAGSEATFFRHIRIYDTVDQEEVEKALEEWC